ncbi:DUF724 domain-containing protein 6 [Vitis vinifera]|uniref:DUF724 domain-containing protein 6 n=1 Tax=Vitis vinifera TaxID=29760 RepID=A0A438E1B7_VITVI|nr:DUF724 domain-containing protein 6 [Vitis vinifera]
MEALVELEMHGFDTKPVQSRINELVFIKDQQEQLKGRTKEVENQIMEHTHEKTKIDEEIYEIDKKMIELQEKRALAVSNKESKDSEMAALLSSADAMNESIQSARQDFERVATSPWGSIYCGRGVKVIFPFGWQKMEVEMRTCVTPLSVRESEALFSTQ